MVHWGSTPASKPPVPAAAWGDAAVIVPWVLYQRYGDAVVLAAQFESMRAWVDLVSKLASEGRLWNWGFQFGDWLDPSAPPDKPGDARTDPHVVATAYFARSAELLGQAAGVLGRTEEEAHYLQLAAEVPEFFVWAMLGEQAATRTALRGIGGDLRAALDAQGEGLTRLTALLELLARSAPQPGGQRERLGRANQAALAKPLVRTKFFSMVNLIAEKRVVPELIQSDFTPDKVAGETIRLLRDANARRAMRWKRCSMMPMPSPKKSAAPDSRPAR